MTTSASNRLTQRSTNLSTAPTSSQPTTNPPRKGRIKNAEDSTTNETKTDNSTKPMPTSATIATATSAKPPPPGQRLIADMFSAVKERQDKDETTPIANPNKKHKNNNSNSNNDNNSSSTKKIDVSTEDISVDEDYNPSEEPAQGDIELQYNEPEDNKFLIDTSFNEEDLQAMIAWSPDYEIEQNKPKQNKNAIII